VSFLSGIMNKLHLKKGQAQTSTLNNSTEMPAHGPLAAGPGYVQQNTVVSAPVIQETIRQDRVIEVQPVLHREVDRTVVHHIEKHIQEAAAPNMGGVIERAPLVQEQIRTNVVNEIQPVIHREIAVPVVERQEQHLSQRVSGDTIHTREVIYEQAPLASGAGFRSTGSSYLGAQAPLAGQQFQQTHQQTGFAPQGGIYQTTAGGNHALHQAGTSHTPLYNPPVMGTPYGSSATTGGRTGHGHHHGVFHRN